MDALVRLAKKDNPQVGKTFFKGKMKKKNTGNSKKFVKSKYSKKNHEINFHFLLFL